MIIQKLRQIKSYCEKHDDFCTNCVYYRDNDCSITRAITQLLKTPAEWDLEKFKEILDGVS